MFAINRNHIKQLTLLLSIVIIYLTGLNVCMQASSSITISSNATSVFVPSISLCKRMIIWATKPNEKFFINLLEEEVPFGAKIDLSTCFDDCRRSLITVAMNSFNYCGVIELVRRAQGDIFKTESSDGRNLVDFLFPVVDIPYLKMLYDNGVEAFDYDKKEQPVMTPLTQAIYSKDMKLFEFIVSKSTKEDINIDVVQGESPLISALTCSNFAAARRLLDLGADPLAKLKTGKSAFAQMVYLDCCEKVIFILEYYIEIGEAQKQAKKIRYDFNYRKTNRMEGVFAIFNKKYYSGIF